MPNNVDLITSIIKALMTKGGGIGGDIKWSAEGTGENSDEAIERKLRAAQTREKFNKPSGKPVTGALNAAKLKTPKPPEVKPTTQGG